MLQSKALNLRLTRAEIAQVTKFADKDDDGVITFDEFVPIVEQLLNRVAMKKNKKKGHSVCGPADAKNKSRTARQTWKYAKNMVSLTGRTHRTVVHPASVSGVLCFCSTRRQLTNPPFSISLGAVAIQAMRRPSRPSRPSQPSQPLRVFCS